jgi:membrane protease YdiL (CAAX protease family)
MIPKPIDVIRIVLITLLAFILYSMLLSLIPNWKEYQSFFLIIGNLIFFIFPYLYGRIWGFDLNTLFRTKGISITIIFYSVILGLGLSVLSDEIDRLLRLIVTPPEWISQQADLLKIDTIGDGFLLIIGTIILTPVCEELVFRGFVQVPFEQTSNPNRAIIISSLLWTAIHLTIFWAIPIFIMGIFLGYLAWQTRSTVPAIIVHSINNAIALLYINYNFDTEIQFYLWHDHVSPVMLIIAAAMVYFSIRMIKNSYISSK